jgi:hypothetical protein
MSSAFYTEMLKRPIAYHPVFRKIAGSTAAAVMLSQMYYWSSEGRIAEDRDGWFHKTIDEWEMETGLSRSEQDRARRDLKGLGVLEDKRKGNPARMWFRLNTDALLLKVAEFAESCKPNKNISLQDSANKESDLDENTSLVPESTEKAPENVNENISLQNPTNKIAESCKQDCRIQHFSLQDSANYLTENTTEITSESKSEEQSAHIEPDVFSKAIAHDRAMISRGDTRERFAMHWQWSPGQAFGERCKAMGIPLGNFEPEQSEEILSEFRSYWESRPESLNQSGWEHKLATLLKRRIVDRQSATALTQSQPISKSAQRAVVSAAVMDVHDTDW